MALEEEGKDEGEGSSCLVFTPDFSNKEYYISPERSASSSKKDEARLTVVVEWVDYPNSNKGRRVIAGKEGIPKDTPIACMRFRAHIKDGESATEEKFAIQCDISNSKDHSGMRDWGFTHVCLYEREKKGICEYVNLVGLRDGGLSEVACRINTLMPCSKKTRKKKKKSALSYNCKMSQVFLEHNVPCAWISSIKDIKEGEELFWDYGYSKSQLKVQFSADNCKRDIVSTIIFIIFVVYF